MHKLLSVLPVNYILCSKKGSHETLREVLADFHNSFIGRFISKSAVQRLLKQKWVMQTAMPHAAT